MKTLTCACGATGPFDIYADKIMLDKSKEAVIDSEATVLCCSCSKLYTLKSMVDLNTSPPMDKTYCTGCEDNFYNGNNAMGVTECWNFKNARMVPRKRVHINDVPPWNNKPTLMPSCYREKQFIFVDPHVKN